MAKKADAQSNSSNNRTTEILRYSASKVAALVGLHEYADPCEDFLEVCEEKLHAFSVF
jgi:hypothetical protein